jgi:hypothetical protein
MSHVRGTFCSIFSTTFLMLSAWQAKIVFGLLVSLGDVLPAKVAFNPKLGSFFEPFAITKLENSIGQCLGPILVSWGRG